MSATVDTTDLSYGAGAVANSRPAVYSNISGAGLWYMLYAKSTGTYYATSSDGTSWTTHSALSGLNGHLIGAAQYHALADMAGNIMVAYPGNHATGDLYMLWLDSGGWDTSPSIMIGTQFGGATAHLYEGAATYFRAMTLYGGPATMRTTTPSGSTSTWADDEFLSGNAPGDGSACLHTVTTNLVAVYIQDSGTLSLRFTEYDLDTVPGSTQFPTCTDVLANASLDKNFASAVDATGLLHLVYRIAGTGWREATYDGATWTTGGALTQLTDNDRSPALMCDGAGDLHLFYARYNAASDYGIGYIKQASGGAWTAQSDTVTHNATNRTSVTISEATSSTAALLTWVEGGTTIKALGVTVAPVGVNPVVATISRTAVGPSSVSFSVSAAGGTSPYTYQWYRSLDSAFTPDGTNDLSGETSTTLTDTPPDAQLYYYKCVATDNVAATDESNQLPGLLYNATLVLGFIGDSITSGTESGVSTVSPAQAMAERLSIWAGIRTVTVVDQAVSGSGAGDWQPGATNYDTASAAFTSAGVQYVSVMLGTNGQSNTPPYDSANVTAFLSDMSTILSQLVTDGFIPIVHVPPYIALDTNQLPDRYLAAIGAGLATLADGSTIYLGDTQAYTWFTQHADALFDGVHPGVLGIQTLGSLWALAFRAAFLVALLALAPASDVSNAGSWTTNTGGTSNLYAAVDEGVPFNQTDYLQSPTDPSSSTVVLALGTSGAPATNADHTLRIQLKRG